MQNLFKGLPGIGQKKTVRCPRCLNYVKIDKIRTHNVCDQKLPDQHGLLTIPCQYEFPPLYTENYGEIIPAPVQVFGWSSHGKTVFLNAMRLMLMNMQQVWPQYNYRAITDRDIELSRLLRTEMENGIMPQPTQPLNLHDNYIYIMELDHMVRWGSRFLVVMDHAGERFDSLEEFKAQEIPFLTHRDTTTLMFLSIPLLQGKLIGSAAIQQRELQKIAQHRGEELPRRMSEHFGHSMNELLTIYIQAMITHDKHEMQREQGGGLLKNIGKAVNTIIRQRRKLVVILTMADAFIDELPPQLRNYIQMDDTWDRVFFYHKSMGSREMDVDYMEQYMDRMQKVSQAIRDWLLNDMHQIGGGEFVKSIESNNIEARYTIVSSLGHNEVSTQLGVGQALGTKIAPKRVLDPFFWILEYQKFRS